MARAKLWHTFQLFHQHRCSRCKITVLCDTEPTEHRAYFSVLEEFGHQLVSNPSIPERRLSFLSTRPKTCKKCLWTIVFFVTNWSVRLQLCLRSRCSKTARRNAEQTVIRAKCSSKAAILLLLLLAVPLTVQLFEFILKFSIIHHFYFLQNFDSALLYQKLKFSCNILLAYLFEDKIDYRGRSKERR